jgi:hypothetical protein
MAARNPKLIESLAWQRATEGLTALLEWGWEVSGIISQSTPEF